MNTIENQFMQRSPWSDLFFLMLICFACMLGTQLLALGLMHYLTNEKVSTYVLFGSGTIGAFIIPALIYKQRRGLADLFPKENVYDWKLYLLGALFLVSMGPLTSIIGEYNRQMVLPDSLKVIEDWMRTQEDLMADITAKVVMVDRIDLLLVNVLVIAVLPAIGEELIFRGALQDIFTRVLRNKHLAVWVVGIIFSAIHIQFFGFFPRFILGVIFGYLLLWTNNIWVPIFAHFVNNAAICVIAFYYTTQGKTYAELMASDSYSIFVYLGSLIISFGIALVFYRYSHKNKRYGEKLD